MAKTAIAAGDVTIIRNSARHILTGMTLDILAPPVVATLTVTAVPAKTPFVELTVSGSMSAVEPYMRVKVVDGSMVKTWGIVRKAPSGSTLFISPVSLGAPGVPERVENPIAVDDTVVVYGDFPLWVIPSRIAGGKFYKFWDIAYTNQNSVPDPKANPGPAQRAAIAAGTARFTLPKGGVNTSFALGSATITSYSWTLPAGVSLVSGYAATDAVIAVDAAAGQHRIALTVTDSNGKTHKAYLWLFVEDGSAYTSFGKRFTVQIESDQSGLDGRTMRFTAYRKHSDPDLGFGTLFPGALALFTYTASFDGSTLADGILASTVVGYVDDLSVAETGEYSRVSFAVKSPVVYVDKLGIPPQLLTDVSAPAKWTQATSVLTNPRGAVMYTARWHVPNLRNHDFDLPYTTPRDKSYEFSGSNVGEHLRVAAEQIKGSIGSADDGTLVMRKIPTHENNAYRNGLAVVWTWIDADVQPDLEYERRLLPDLAELRAGGFSYNGSKIGAWAAIKRWYAGTGKTSAPDFSVTPAEGLARVKEVVGHLMAEANADVQSVTIKPTRLYDFVEPVYLVWHRLDLAAYDPLAQRFNSERVYPTQVARRWDLERGTCELAVTFKPDTFGQPGEQYTVGNAKNSIKSGWSVVKPTPYTPKQDSVPGLFWPHNAAGKVGRTASFLSSAPDYQDFSDLVAGTVCDLCLDYNSSFFKQGFNQAGQLSAYLVSASGTNLNIYRVEDLRETTPTLTLLKTYTMGDSTVTTSARVRCSETVPDFVAVHWCEGTHCRVGRSTDGGATWGSIVEVGSSFTANGLNDNAECGFDIEGEKQLCTGHDGTNYKVYYASTKSGSFSALGSSPTSGAPFPCIVVDMQGSAYVASPGTAGDKTLFLEPEGSTSMTGSTSNFDWAFTDSGNWEFGIARFSPSGFLGSSQFSPETDPLSVTVEWNMLTPKIADALVVELIAVHGSWNAGTFGAHSFPLTFEVEDSLGNVQTFNESLDFPDYATEGDLNQYDDFFGTLTLTPATAVVRVTITMGFGAIANEPDFDDFFYDIWIGPISGPTTSNSFYLSGDGSSGAQLRRVDTYSGSPSWTVITPATDLAPGHPYALAVNRANKNQIMVVASDGMTAKRFTSTNQGGSWTDNGFSNHKGVKWSGDLLLLVGDEQVDFSMNNGVSFQDREGDLSAAWGGIGRVRGGVILL